MANSAATATKVKRAADAEIAALSKIGKMIGELDEASRVRVLAYLHARYCIDGNAVGNAAGGDKEGSNHVLD